MENSREGFIEKFFFFFYFFLVWEKIVHFITSAIILHNRCGAFFPIILISIIISSIRNAVSCIKTKTSNCRNSEIQIKELNFGKLKNKNKYSCISFEWFLLLLRWIWTSTLSHNMWYYPAYIFTMCHVLCTTKMLSLEHFICCESVWQKYNISSCQHTNACIQTHTR